MARTAPATWTRGHRPQPPTACAASQPSEIAIIVSGAHDQRGTVPRGKLAEALGVEQGDIVPRIGEADGYLIAADRNPNTDGRETIMGIDSPGTELAAIREGVRAGAIKAVVALGENLLKEAGFTDARSWTRSSSCVAVHILANPTAAAADVVLPAAACAEKRGSMINVTGRLQRLNKAVEPARRSPRRLGNPARPARRLRRQRPSTTPGTSSSHGRRGPASPVSALAQHRRPRHPALSKPASPSRSSRREASASNAAKSPADLHCHSYSPWTGSSSSPRSSKSSSSFGIVLTLVPVSVYAERRVSAIIQDRVGPNRVGIPLTCSASRRTSAFFGLFQPLPTA